MYFLSQWLKNGSYSIFLRCQSQVSRKLDEDSHKIVSRPPPGDVEVGQEVDCGDGSPSSSLLSGNVLGQTVKLVCVVPHFGTIKNSNHSRKLMKTSFRHFDNENSVICTQKWIVFIKVLTS